MVCTETWEEAEALVRGGVDSRRLVVAPASQPQRDAALQSARAGMAAGRGPLPPAPHSFDLRCLVLLPTYNERANIAAIVGDVLAYLDADVLVIDDASPDGTGEIAQRVAGQQPRVRVLHRPRKMGLGTAYLAGFRQAIEGGYARVFEMDADFSHPPWDLPRLAFASLHADLVIGSRYVKGGSTLGWDLRRRLLSRGANLYARALLALPLRDTTAGFRCYRVDALARLELSKVAAEGYAFQIEMAYRMARAGFRVAEIPIHFSDRAAGKSKMDGKVAREAIRLVPALRWKVRRGEVSPGR